jgi:hypothetical protein
MVYAEPTACWDIHQTVYDSRWYILAIFEAVPREHCTLLYDRKSSGIKTSKELMTLNKRDLEKSKEISLVNKLVVLKMLPGGAHAS